MIDNSDLARSLLILHIFKNMTHTIVKFKRPFYSELLEVARDFGFTVNETTKVDENGCNLVTKTINVSNKNCIALSHELWHILFYYYQNIFRIKHEQSIVCVKFKHQWLKVNYPNTLGFVQFYYQPDELYEEYICFTLERELKLLIDLAKTLPKNPKYLRYKQFCSGGVGTFLVIMLAAISAHLLLTYLFNSIPTKVNLCTDPAAVKVERENLFTQLL